MATIAINDLEINQELDSQALQNILGGRWVLRTYYQKYRRTYYRTVRYTAYRRTAFTQTYTRAYRRWVWA